MSADHYFNALCNAEAGDFIYKRVQDVDGIAELRPRSAPNDYALQHLYALEDPFGVAFGAAGARAADLWVQPFGGRYTFLDVVTKTTPTAVFVTTFYRDARNAKATYQSVIDGRYVVLPYVIAHKETRRLSARYGFTWRGIKRPNDRELGIAGGELIVLDVSTGDILGMRRGFVKTGSARNSFGGIWWLNAAGCAQNGRNVNGRKERLLHQDFIYSVLVPRREANNEYLGALNGRSK